jgi:hypothetical protein
MLRVAVTDPYLDTGLPEEERCNPLRAVNDNGEKKRMVEHREEDPV